MATATNNEKMHVGGYVPPVGKRHIGLEAVARQPTTGNVIAATTVVPGMEICPSEQFMRGSGTIASVDGKTLVSTLAGRVEQVNRLLTVRALRTRYSGEVGDVVVGRIVDVQQSRWKVDVNARLNANLLLASVNLPAGELRRKSAEDELAMIEYLNRGDLISAEVQNVHMDGTISLHTRSLKYGKLGQGLLVTIPPGLVKRRKSHFMDLPCGATVIIGYNGFIWITPVDASSGADGGYNQNLEEIIPTETREVLARIGNCIKFLATNSILVYDTTILEAYERSLAWKPADLLRADVANSIAANLIEKFADVEE